MDPPRFYKDEADKVKQDQIAENSQFTALNRCFPFQREVF